MTRLGAAYPISGEDLMALPVRAIDPAVAYYRDVLGFEVVRHDPTTATLARDAARLGLVARHDHDPGTAGSVAMAADDLDALHRELERSGARPGEFDVQEWGGRRHRVFFVREDENGYCYCFFRTL